ncbi:hypothetical protein [Streptomyces sp. S1D4-20]|uniref:hypothetical protein n=1 Tax=Streptomyces sp. S1D4-20 TaxID=2594462 RepID=UPI001162ACEF|nr:hypothetical protein [Streptomyces sp. S1D4-20]QDN54090.1 hypothetical protein FNV67_00480 [Streptomyces sp. S1D4-20]
MNLLAIHTHTPDGSNSHTSACPRAACGAAETTHGSRPTHCTAHGSITVQHHRAIDCPELPADADLSRLWLITPTWSATGPIAGNPQPFSRSSLDELRRAHALWDLALGDTAEEAMNTWKTRITC